MAKGPSGIGVFDIRRMQTAKAQVCCFLGFRNRDIRGISNDYILGELKGMMPKGRKELHTLELSGCISAIQMIGSSHSYLCSPLLLFPTLHYIQSAVSQTLHAAVKLCPSPHLPACWFPTQTLHDPLNLLLHLYMGPCWNFNSEMSQFKKRGGGTSCFQSHILLLYSRVGLIVMSLRGQWAASQVAEVLFALEGTFACGT